MYIFMLLLEGSLYTPYLNTSNPFIGSDMQDLKYDSLTSDPKIPTSKTGALYQCDSNSKLMFFNIFIELFHN